MAQQQWRQVDMNRLALACVTVVELVDVVVFDDVAGMTIDLDGAALSVVVEYEKMACSFGADGDDENAVVARLVNDKQILRNTFELFDHLKKISIHRYIYIYIYKKSYFNLDISLHNCT